MANHKRKKCKRQVRCGLCTSDRFGNSPQSFKTKDWNAKKLAEKEIKENS